MIDFKTLPHDTLHLVGCSASKDLDEGSMMAMLRYTGDLFKKTAELLSEHNCRWRILSAEYGCLYPSEHIQAYDATLPKERYWLGYWAGGVVHDLIRSKALETGRTTVVFWAGKRYRNALAAPLRMYAKEILVPLEGLGIGQQKRALKKLLEADK